MNIDFNKALEQLAEAFNTTVEHLYPILIKQAYVAGITAAVVGVISIILFTIVLRMALKSKKKKNDDKGFESWQWTDEGIPFMISITVTGLFMFFCVLEMMFTVPTALFNPEYWAIKEILSNIK